MKDQIATCTFIFSLSLSLSYSWFFFILWSHISLVSLQFNSIDFVDQICSGNRLRKSSDYQYLFKKRNEKKTSYVYIFASNINIDSFSRKTKTSSLFFPLPILFFLFIPLILHLMWEREVLELYMLDYIEFIIENVDKSQVLSAIYFAAFF